MRKNYASSRIKPLLLGFALMLISATAIADILPAKAFRWSGAGDVVTLDPHATPDSFSDGMMHNVYERLLSRDKLFQLVPSLAVSWTQSSPTLTRFTLRKGVTFHDGTPFTADDVVFSLNRMQRPTSSQRASMAGISEVVRVDDLTVDIITTRPLPTLLSQLATAPIMSKAWLIKHGISEPHDYTGGKESYAARNANGTGPFMVKAHESGVKIVMAANPRWWGKREGNVDEVTFRPLKSNATRVAALLSGETDLLIDPPPQDLDRLTANAKLKIVKGAEHRVLVVSFDGSREELQFSSVKGRNPFRDKRVREAVSLAIDTEAIHQKVMRGLSQPTGTVVPKGTTGYSEKAAKRATPDIERAKRLLSEAGYPQGFGVSLDCTNDRYILDEQICVAVAGMVSRIGIQVSTNLRPKAIFFQKVDVGKRETSFFMYGMATPTGDAMMVLDGLLHTYDRHTLGENNIGHFSLPKMDALLDAARYEMNPTKRDALMEEAQLQQNEEHFYVPIHQQVTPWVMRREIEATHRPDNYLDLRWVTIN